METLEQGEIISVKYSQRTVFPHLFRHSGETLFRFLKILKGFHIFWTLFYGFCDNFWGHSRHNCNGVMHAWTVS